MYSPYQDREQLEDDLYKEDDEDSEGSEVNSELEFHLYSQLHYSSNAGEMEEEMEEEMDKVEEEDDHDKQLEVTEKTVDVDREENHTEESSPPSPVHQLPQHLQKKDHKCDKQKTKKTNLKGQRSSSFAVEEVIVIDSSPEVISISEGDTADDDEGVCALKGQGSQRLQTSTPLQQGTQKRKIDVSMPVTVVSSSSESDSESSESKSESFDSSDDSSDSENLENWMILGQGNREEDLSISLNLEGGSDIIADAEGGDGTWLVSDRDKEAQIYNKERGTQMAAQRLSNRYYTMKNVQCRNCNKTGHLSKNCPEPKRVSPCFLCGFTGHIVNQCPNRHCNNCGMPGHFYDSCMEKAYYHKQCHRCNMKGHFFDACPEIWRQYHITTKPGLPVEQRGKDRVQNPAYCYNCSKKGHFGHECMRQRMFNGTFPTTSFINHYDTVADIKRRQHRIKLKVKELKENGFLPTDSQVLFTPGPPKKKQKINHHKNSHHPHHAPQPSPNNHTPSPSHFFFKDHSDIKTPKTRNKYKQQESNVKPWKPKRPVPTSRNTPTKLILDEAEDFPRGRGKKQNIEVKRKNKKMKKKPNQVPEGNRGGRPGHLFWTAKGETPGSQSKSPKGKGWKKSQTWRMNDQKQEERMYPTDENLFTIKQRKRRR
ncbi:uncharacterized protein V6R79_006634 [Siganus canaliculatus]